MATVSVIRGTPSPPPVTSVKIKLSAEEAAGVRLVLAHMTVEAMKAAGVHDLYSKILNADIDYDDDVASKLTVRNDGIYAVGE